MTEPAPLIEVSPPDIAVYRHGNTGVDYVTTLDSGRAGPHVVVNALTHGNEVCGAIAMDALFRMGFRPRLGRVTLCLANVAAYQGFDAAHPYVSRYVDEDFNRLWAPDRLDGPGDSQELRRARALRPLYDRADLLLDLHSMTTDGDPMILCGRTERARELARRLGHPAWIVADSGHRAGPRLLEYDPFADPAGTRTALLVECGQHWRRETADVALETCLRFLLAHGMIDPDLARPHLPERSTPPRVVEVTHAVTAHSDAFVFDRDFATLEILPHAGTPVGMDGDRPVVTPYDDCVLVMPTRRPRQGQTAVRLGRLVP